MLLRIPLIVTPSLIIVPLIIIVLVPLESTPAIVILLPLLLLLLLLATQPRCLRPVHVIRRLIVIETEVFRGRHTHPVLIVSLPGVVIASICRVILVGICLPGVRRPDCLVVVHCEVQGRLPKTSSVCGRIRLPRLLLGSPLVVLHPVVIIGGCILTIKVFEYINVSQGLPLRLPPSSIIAIVGRPSDRLISIEPSECPVVSRVGIRVTLVVVYRCIRPIQVVIGGSVVVVAIVQREPGHLVSHC